MGALQMYYTSCRKGRGGGAGFQTRAASEGLRVDEQREIAARGDYRKPRDAPDSPTDEEIELLFPKAYRHYLLSDGRQAITLSCYAGRDYSGRWDNFFAHTLVFPRDLGSRWPIDLFEWPGWQRRLAPEDDTDNVPPDLPPLNTDEIPDAPSFSLGELSVFLREDPSRPTLLATLIRAVLAGRKSRRAVVVRDTELNGLYWLACLQKAVSPAHLRSLSFSSYQFHPQTAADVNATTGETDFVFDENARNFYWYAFDCFTGRHSTLPAEPDDFAAIAARWMAEAPDTMRAFQGFLETLTHTALDEGLLSAARLFRLVRGESPVLAAPVLAEVAAFAAEHGGRADRTALLAGLAHGLEALGPGVDPAVRLSLWRALAAAAGSADQRAVVFGSWLKAFDDAVRGRGGSVADVQAGLAAIREALPGQDRELAGRFLVPQRFTALATISPAGLEHLLAATVDQLDAAGRLPVGEQPEAQVVIDALSGVDEPIEASAERIFRWLRAEPDDVVRACRRLLQAASGNLDVQQQRRHAVTLGRGLGRAAPAAVPVYERLIAAALDDVVFGAWLERIEIATDKENAHRGFRDTVLTRLPEFGRRYAERMAAALLRRVPPDRKPPLAMGWVEDGSAERFGPATLASCLEQAVRLVSLEPSDAISEQRGQTVARLAGKAGVTLRPDRMALRRALRAAATPGLPFDALPLAGLGEELAALEPGQYLQFLTGFLGPALLRAGNNREHGQVLLDVCVEGRRDTLRRVYFDAVDRAGRGDAALLSHGVRFWLVAGSAPGVNTALGWLRDEAMQAFAEALGRAEPDFLTGLDAKIRGVRLLPEEADLWDRTYEAARSSGRGLAGGIKHLWSRSRSGR